MFDFQGFTSQTAAILGVDGIDLSVTRKPNGALKAYYWVAIILGIIVAIPIIIVTIILVNDELSMLRWWQLSAKMRVSSYNLLAILFAPPLCIGLVLGLIWLLTVPIFQAVVFILIILFISVGNALLGIIAAGVSIGFAIISLYNSDPANVFSLLSFIDVAPGQGQVITVVLMLVASIVGAIENVGAFFDL